MGPVGPHRTGLESMTFVEMFAEICRRHPQKVIARGLDCSVQYVSDLKAGRRLPSVTIVNAICKWMGRGPQGRLAWHQAGARAHGWELDLPAHKWVGPHPPIKWEHCESCGVVKRTDGKNTPTCKGPARVTARTT